MHDYRREWYPADQRQKHGPVLPRYHGTLSGKGLLKTPWNMVNKQLLVFGKPSVQKFHPSFGEMYSITETPALVKMLVAAVSTLAYQRQREKD